MVASLPPGMNRAPKLLRGGSQKEPRAIGPSPESPLLPELVEADRYRGTLRSHKLRQRLVSQSKGKDDTFALYPTPAVGEMPEQDQQPLVNASHVTESKQQAE